ncbi:hypothetical protein ARMSODRAFT_975840 [Armillaria solidipes]|uniref:Uncharacterized protein n=1 Tax=Armillaria solidipes TaxID=1076256 RepID=A0A2H3BX10_9AGAR|nr:hypothetical protein ARMSODRAFT_975840 [Armillaria solidipes]
MEERKTSSPSTLDLWMAYVVPELELRANGGLNMAAPTRCTGEGHQGEIKATWLGYAFFLVEIPFLSSLGRCARLLVESAFCNTYSPTQFLCPMSYTEPPCEIKDMSEVDVVEISLNHYDRSPIFFAANADAFKNINVTWSRIVPCREGLEGTVRPSNRYSPHLRITSLLLTHAYRTSPLAQATTNTLNRGGNQGTRSYTRSVERSTRGDTGDVLHMSPRPMFRLSGSSGSDTDTDDRRNHGVPEEPKKICTFNEDFLLTSL